tara:strand:- start:208 stop:360 length:153 start_codon:yes stop_codon:yes gene_type:complete
MKIVDIDELEKKLYCALQVISEVTLAVHQIQEALNQYENDTKEPKKGSPF